MQTLHQPGANPLVDNGGASNDSAFMTFSTLSMPLLLLPLGGGLSARGFGETGISGISKPWTEVPSAPMAGDALLEDGNRLLQGLGLSFSTNWIHDSNVNQANERDLRVESDWILSLAPAVTWETQVRDFSLALCLVHAVCLQWPLCAANAAYNCQRANSSGATSDSTCAVVNAGTLREIAPAA